MFCRARVEFSPLDAEEIEIVKERSCVLFCELVKIKIIFTTHLDDPVIHICQIHHLCYFVAAVLEKSAKEIFKQKRSVVADMRIIPNSRAARVHPYLSIIKGFEFFQLSP